jgi:DNA-binding CsgD family transcriptional regulator
VLSGGGAPLDARESRRVEAAVDALDRLPTNAAASGIFDAIKLCVPVQAGLFSFIRPAAPEALVSQAVGLEAHIHESWLRTPPAVLERTLAPLVSSSVGSLWRDSETIRGEQREQLEVLTLLDTAGLGEGAGYKAMERTIPGYGTEHVMLALLMERKTPVPARSDVMLSALNPALQRAILRLGLPRLPHQPVQPPEAPEDVFGYLCVSRTGRLVATNLRALHLVDRYADAAGVAGRHDTVAAFATRAMDQNRKARPWQLAHDEPARILQVDVSGLPERSYVLPDDAMVIQMREVPPPPLSAAATRARELLTRMQLRVAILYATTGASDEELAKRLGISEGTVRTHMGAIRERLGVKSRGEIAARIMW